MIDRERKKKTMNRGSEETLSSTTWVRLKENYVNIETIGEHKIKRERKRKKESILELPKVLRRSYQGEDEIKHG